MLIFFWDIFFRNGFLTVAHFGPALGIVAAILEIVIEDSEMVIEDKKVARRLMMFILLPIAIVLWCVAILCCIPSLLPFPIL